MLLNKNKYGVLLIVALSMLMVACSAGRNYKRPELTLSDNYIEMPSSGDSSMATQSWKEFFSDAALLALIEKAIDNNFDLRIALKNIESSRAYAKQARVAWLPSLALQASASTTNPSQNSLNGISLENFVGVDHIEDYTLGATVSWELDIWGKLRRQRETALAEYLQTQEATRAIQTSIVAQVAQGYYNLLMMDEQLRIAQRNVVLSDSIVQVMRLQKTAGEVTELAVQQAVSQQQDAALLVPQLKQAIAEQENALRLLTGDLPGGIARTSSLQSVTFNDDLSTGVPIDLVSFRPDVRAQEQALVAANARVGVAQANMYPSLVLTASGGLNAFEASNWFTMPASLFGTAAGSLMQPVFNRRQLKTQKEVAIIEREQRVISFRQSVTAAVHEVTNALIRLDMLARQQEVATARAEVLESAVTNAQLLFRSGLANYLEVISAQSRTLQAQLEKASITRQQLAARVTLYQSLGGGWH